MCVYFYSTQLHPFDRFTNSFIERIALSKPHQALLNKLNYQAKLNKVDEAIRANADFLREIADTVGSGMFGDDDSDEEEENEQEEDEEGGYLELLVCI